MRIAEFEKLIQGQYDERMNIRVNPNADDIAGVYVGDEYLGVAVPPQEIKTVKDDDYCDIYGTPYRTVEEALETIKNVYAKKYGGEN